MQRSFSSEAIVIKRHNIGEYDRIVTLLTPDQGKVTCIAKGVRKITSSQRAFLEPGNYVSIFFVNTSGMPLITQTKLLNNYPEMRQDLQHIKKLAEVLEIIDLLFPEGVEEPELFQQITKLLEHLSQVTSSFRHVQEQLGDILIQLGYQDFKETTYTSILSYVAAVADRPMRSYDYLTVKTLKGTA